MPDRSGGNSVAQWPSGLCVVRVEEAEGITWGMIAKGGVVVRAPFERFVGATADQVMEWALYAGHRLKLLDIAVLQSSNGAAG